MPNQFAFLKLPSGICINLAHISTIYRQGTHLVVYCTGRAAPVALSDPKDKEALCKAIEEEK